MVAYNFKKEFAGDVESGAKTQTIREKKRCKVGDKLQLYTGMRTKVCRKLKDAVCIGTADIKIDREVPWLLSNTSGEVHMSKDGKRFHELDGFKSIEAMVAFFEKNYKLPFEGFLTVWGDDNDV